MRNYFCIYVKLVTYIYTKLPIVISKCHADWLLDYWTFEAIGRQNIWLLDKWVVGPKGF